MRNMLAFLAAVVLTVAAVGFYLDWFNIHRVTAPDGHSSFALDVNTEKIGEDLRKAEENLQKKLAEKAKENPAPAKTKTPAEDGNINVFIEQ